MVGVWTGYNRIELRLVDSAGRNRASRHVEHPLRTLEAEALLDVLARTITSFAEDNGAGDVKAIGLACQGYVDTRDGVVAWSPVLGTRDLPLAAGLNRRLGKPVLIENDASAMAFAIAQRHPALRSGPYRLPDDRRWRRPRLPGPGRTLSRRTLRRQRIRACAARRSGPQCRCGGRGCIEAFLADYALHRDAQLIDHRPAPTALIPSEDAMSSIVAQAQGGRSGAPEPVSRSRRGAGRRRGHPRSRPSSLIISSSAAPAPGPWTCCDPSFEAALESQTIPELRSLATIHVVRILHGYPHRRRGDAGAAGARPRSGAVEGRLRRRAIAIRAGRHYLWGTFPSRSRPMASSRPVAAGDHVFLVDGSSFIFRAYFQSMNQDSKYNSRISDGMPTGAVRLFVTKLLQFIREGAAGLKPTHLAIVLDKSEGSFRKELYADYKGHRPDPPSDLIVQMPLMREAIRAFGLEPIELERYEADDLIATYTQEAKARGRQRADHLVRQGPDAARRVRWCASTISNRAPKASPATGPSATSMKPP